MPDELSYVEKARKSVDKVSDFIILLTKEPYSKSAELNIFGWQMHIVKQYCYNVLEGDFSATTKEDYKNVIEALKNVKDGINLYLAQLDKKELTEVEQKLKDGLLAIADDFTKPDGLYPYTIEVCANYLGFVDDIHTGKIEQDIKKQYNRANLNGVRPTVDELLNLKPSLDNVTDTMDRILWLSKYNYEYGRLYVNVPNGNIYKDIFENFIEELKVAPFDVQAAYVKETIWRIAALQDKAYEKYQEFLNNPKSQPADEYAMKKLFESEEYHLCDAFTLAFRNSLVMSPYASFLRAATGIKGPEGSKRLCDRESEFIGELLSGEMQHFFEKHNITDYTTTTIDAFSMGKYEEGLQNEDFVHSKSFDDAVLEYKKLSDDKEKASESFEYMRDTLNAFLSNPTESSSDTYEYRLRTARDAAKAYVDSHSGYRFTDNGKARQTIANSVLNHLNTLYSEYEVRRGKDLNLNEYKESSAPLPTVFTNLVSKFSKTSLSVDELVSMVQKERSTPAELNDIDEEYVIPAEKREERKALSIKAEASLLKSRVLLNTGRNAVLHGIDLLEYKEQDIKNFIERDLVQILFDYGDDVVTRRKNMDAAHTLIGKRLPDKKRGKQIRDYVDGRINQFAQRDLSKYENMSDAELVENFEQFTRDCFVVTELHLGIKKLAKDNHISQESIEKAEELVNKYSNLAYYLTSKMECISNPYYESIDCEKVTKNDPEVFNQLVENIDDTTLSRYCTAMSGTKEGMDEHMLSKLKVAAYPNPTNEKMFNGILFFDINGKELEDFDVKQIIKEGGSVIVVSPHHPTSIKAFSLDENKNFVEAEVQPAEDVIKSCFETSIANAYKVCGKINMKDQYQPGAYSSLVEDVYKSSGTFIFNLEAKSLGYNMDTDPKLIEFFGAVFADATEEELYYDERFENYKDDIHALYKAAKIDKTWDAAREDALEEVVRSANFAKINKASLTRVKNELVLPKLENAKDLKRNMEEELIDWQLINTKGLPTSNKAFEIVQFNPELSEEEKNEIALESRTPEGRKKLIHGIVDEVLNLDPEKIMDLDYNDFLENFKEVSYIKNMIGDCSYIDNFPVESQGMFSPYELEQYKDYLSYLQPQINKLNLIPDVYSSEAALEIDFENITAEQAVAASRIDKENSALWASVIAIKAPSKTPEEMKKGQEGLENVIQSRWVNALLAKPGLSEDEKQLINSFNNDKDGAYGRSQLYSYAMQRILDAASEDEFPFDDPEYASYRKLMGQSAKYMMAQMKRDGYEVDKDILENLEHASNILSSEGADITIALNKGRSINEKNINYEIELHKKQVEAKRNELIGQVQKEEASHFMFLSSKLNEHNKPSIIEHGSKVLYLHSLEQRIKEAPEEKITGFPGLDDLSKGATAEKFKADFKVYLDLNKDFKFPDAKSLDSFAKDFDDFRTVLAASEIKKAEAEKILKQEDAPKVEQPVAKN